MNRSWKGLDLKYLHLSKDPIEQLYCKDVTKHFQNYEIFWHKFVGDPKADEVKPYTYTFPAGDESSKRKFEQIRMVHYSLFCHLAGTHYHLEQLSNVHKVSDSNERYFRHWEHFDTAYIHLGSVFYVVYCLWNIVLKMKGVTDGGYEGKLVAFLKAKGKAKLLQSFQDLEDQIKTRRDILIHQARPYAFPHKGKFYVPINLEINTTWSEQARITGLRETVQMLREDLIETEKTLDQMHDLLIHEFEDLLEEKGIAVNR